MIKILLVEDDIDLRRLIFKYLISQGYQVFEAENGEKAFTIFDKDNSINLVITDIMMPKIDGFTLSNKIREKDKNIPILMFTALEDFLSKEKGYLCGVDDYMVKPINLKELGLRIGALLRRYQIVNDSKIKLKHIFLDEKNLECLVDGVLIPLTIKEFKLLYKFLSYPNVIFTREQLMNDIWGYDSESYDRTVDTHIKRIREQIATDDFEIISVRGLGYKAVIK